jgi:hypothetical protein
MLTMSRECGAKSSGERAMVVGIFAAALLLAAVVASLPVKTLVGVVPDDAFYYLAVGRNIATTGVSTFDGENLASGYHPGWMMLVAIVAHGFQGNDGLLRVVVAMAFLLHATAGWLLYLCLKRFVSGVAAALAAGFWMFGYLPLVLAGFAMETSLYCVAFLLSYLAYLGRVEPHLRSKDAEGPNRIPAKDLLLFGAALGLCLWARTEAIVLLACVVAWLGLAALRRRTFLKSLVEACRRGVLTGGAAMAVITPWLLYGLYTFGTIRQASGVMKTLWMQDEVAGLNLGERLTGYVCRFSQWLAYSLPWAWGSGRSMAAAMAIGWLILFIAAWVFVVRGPMKVRQAIAGVFPSVAYPLLHLFVAGAVYSTCFADLQDWYLALPYLECYLVLAISGGTIYRAASAEERSRRWPAKALAVAVVFTILGLVRYAQTLQQGYWVWQRDVYASIEPIGKILPDGARIGCFNAGIPGYFSQWRVINLDGLMNDAVVPYWRENRFDQYLSDANIGMICDEEMSMARARRFSRGFPKLEEVARYRLTNYIADTRFLWALKPSVDGRQEGSSPFAQRCYGRNTRRSSSPTGL